MPRCCKLARNWGGAITRPSFMGARRFALRWSAMRRFAGRSLTCWIRCAPPPDRHSPALPSLPFHDGTLRLLEMVSQCLMIVLSAGAARICVDNHLGDALKLMEQAMPYLFGNCVGLEQSQVRVYFDIHGDMQGVAHPARPHASCGLDSLNAAGRLD